MTTLTYYPREYLSISTLLDFVRCPRRYFYSKCGLVEAGEEPNAPLYGQAMHKAVPVVLTQGLPPAIEAFKSVWRDELSDDKRSLSRAISQLGHFNMTHASNRSLYIFQPPPSGSIKLDEATSDYEVPFVLEIGLPVPLTGRIDALVKHRDTGEYWGWELKTVSGWQWSRIFEGLELHPQVLTYTLALQTLTGLNVRGILAEAMLIDKSKVDNQLQPILVQDHLLEDIHKWLRYYGELLLASEQAALELRSKGASALEMSRVFVKNFAGCTPYPLFYMTASWGCDYRNLCRHKEPENMLSMYSIKPDHKFVTLTKEPT